VMMVRGAGALVPRRFARQLHGTSQPSSTSALMAR
jgi:hypothetical protein